MKLSSRAYDIIKFLCTRLLPAAGTLYFALSKIWGFPYAAEICGTITAICAFMGEVMKISSDEYYKDEQETFYNTDDSGMYLGEEVVSDEFEEDNVLAMAFPEEVEYNEGDELYEGNIFEGFEEKLKEAAHLREQGEEHRHDHDCDCGCDHHKH